MYRSAAVVVLALLVNDGWAQAGPTADKAERCATRLSIAMLGKSPTAAALSKSDPQADVDAMLVDAAFVERFSRFINASFNDDVGATPAEDAPYYLAKYVLEKNLAWRELFVGQFRVDAPAGAPTGTPTVTVDPNGLGYFRSTAWLVRYAGNEEQGIKISTAYRMMQNTLGLKLVASTNAPTADISATGRQAAGCRACHYDSWFALDKVAGVLQRKRLGSNPVTFVDPPGGIAPQQILGGITVANDKELVSALVQSEAFEFRACRLAFEFLYGRPELTCEGPVFDRCMTELKAKGTIQSALAAVAKDPSFCQ